MTVGQRRAKQVNQVEEVVMALVAKLLDEEVEMGMVLEGDLLLELSSPLFSYLAPAALGEYEQSLTFVMILRKQCKLFVGEFI